MPETQLSLFKSLISPILSYSCEIWGFCEAGPIERLHLSFLKSILSVRNNTPSWFVYKELNSFPLKNDRLIRIIKYWLKIIDLDDDNIVRLTYNALHKEATEKNAVNWASLVKDLLNQNGFGYVWK